MNQHSVSLELTEEIKNLMVVDDYQGESRRVAEFISLKGERFHYAAEKDRYFINSFYPSFPSKAWERFIVGAKRMVTEDEFDITIPEEKIESITTVNELVSVIEDEVKVA